MVSFSILMRGAAPSDTRHDKPYFLCIFSLSLAHPLPPPIHTHIPVAVARHISFSSTNMTHRRCHQAPTTSLFLLTIHRILPCSLSFPRIFFFSLVRFDSFRWIHSLLCHLTLLLASFSIFCFGQKPIPWNNNISSLYVTKGENGKGKRRTSRSVLKKCKVSDTSQQSFKIIIVCLTLSNSVRNSFDNSKCITTTAPNTNTKRLVSTLYGRALLLVNCELCLLCTAQRFRHSIRCRCRCHHHPPTSSNQSEWILPKWNVPSRLWPWIKRNVPNPFDFRPAHYAVAGDGNW